MGTLDQKIPNVGPLNMFEASDEINTELDELFKRSLAVIGTPAGTNSYTGSIPLDREIEDGNGFILRVPNANTGACSLNGIPMVSPTGAALQAGQLTTGMEIVMIRHASSNTLRIHTPLSGATAPIVRVYSNPGAFTWTRTAGLRAVRARVQAAGGGGGSVNGSGGGGGEYREMMIPFNSLPSTVTVTVGSGGGGGVGGGGPAADGSPGGASSFGSFATASGGSGGGSGAGAGGDGGAGGSGGDIAIPGKKGGPTLAGTGSNLTGDGGDSPFGGAGGRGRTAGSGVGRAGDFGGGGGGGSTSGGAGGNGIVIVEEIY